MIDMDTDSESEKESLIDEFESKVDDSYDLILTAFSQEDREDTGILNSVQSKNHYSTCFRLVHV